MKASHSVIKSICFHPLSFLLCFSIFFRSCVLYNGSKKQLFIEALWHCPVNFFSCHQQQYCWECYCHSFATAATDAVDCLLYLTSFQLFCFVLLFLASSASSMSLVLLFCIKSFWFTSLLFKFFLWMPVKGGGGEWIFIYGGNPNNTKKQIQSN